MLAEKGYDAATLKEIARAADAAPRLIHYYFGGKDQLLIEVLKDVSNRFTETGEQLRWVSIRDAHWFFPLWYVR